MFFGISSFLVLGYALVIVLAIVLGVFLLLLILAATRALNIYTRTQELKLDLLLSETD
jgi:membrane protein implicated in regulation of membrane protease activity